MRSRSDRRRRAFGNWRKRYRSRKAAIEALKALVPAGTKLIIIDTMRSNLS